MKRYAIFLFAFLLLELAAIAVFNIAADPFGAFGWCLPDVCQARTRASEDLRRVDLTVIERVRPTEIILGSSTALTGLRFDRPGWVKNGSARNLALTGASTQEALWLLQYANNIQHVDQVVIGLDFFMANIRYHDRMSRPSGAPAAIAERYLESIFSLHAIKSSFQSLGKQPHGTPYIDGLGEQNISPSFVASRPGGYSAAFTREERSYLTSNGWFADGLGFDFERDGKSAFEPFRALLRYCYSNNIRLYLFLSPSHARFFSAMRMVGLEPSFLYWKAELARINDAEALRSGRAPFPVWDFSIASDLTAERVPDAGAMTNYVDSAHYTPAIGAIVEKCLFVPDDACRRYGAPLRDDASLPAHLRRSILALDDYEASHPSDVAQLRQLVAQTQSYRDRLPPTGGKTQDRVHAFMRRISAPTPERN